MPCGKCIICRRNRAAEWSVRLGHELEYHQQACFVTLTYDDDHLPYTPAGIPTLVKRDFQLFFKRLRKRIDKKVKYFACGEYGSRTQRPHYHILIFGWQPDYRDLVPIKGGTYLSEEIADMWQKGGVQVGSVTQDSIYYVTGYLLKAGKPVGDRSREWTLVSKGLGLQYALDHKDIIYDGGITVRGKPAPVPKYYLKHVSIDPDKRVRRQIDLEVKIRLRKGFTHKEIGRQYTKLIRSLARSRRQAARNLEAAEAMRQRSAHETDI